jgi:hypothetical protein
VFVLFFLWYSCGKGYQLDTPPNTVVGPRGNFVSEITGLWFVMKLLPFGRGN